MTMTAEYVSLTSPTETKLASEEKQFIRMQYDQCFAFASTDPKISNVRLNPIGYLTVTNHPIRWYVVRIHVPPTDLFDLVNSKEKYLLFKDQKASAGKRLVVEGCHGMGKTTALGKYAGGDLQQLRDGPLGALAGTGDEFGHTCQILRNLVSQNKPYVDRSMWLSSAIYSAYHRKVLFLLQGDELRFMRLYEPNIVILDDPSLSNDDIATRVKARGRMDAHAPNTYTPIVREFYRIVSREYNIPTVTPDELQQMIQ